MKNGQFSLAATDGKARAGTLQTAHGAVETPVFMPVGTKASVKSLDPRVLGELGTQILLGNTYHLYLAPGDELIRDLGGLHQFMHWDGPILTDSGGFQVFSLGAGKKARSSVSLRGPEGRGNPQLSDTTATSIDRHPSSNGARNDDDWIIPEAIITDDGVEFRSHKDGSKHGFTPEKSIDIQANLGADIMMAFDECPPYPSTNEDYRTSMERTHQWLERCITHKKQLENTVIASTRGTRQSTNTERSPRFARDDDGTTKSTLPQDQLLFGIVQGGLSKDLREESAKFVSAQDLPGIAIGGVANGGEERTMQMRQVEWVLPHLPENKPRYLMGVGTPLDLIEFVARGVDMFDCVLPTRLARNGAVWIVEDGKWNMENGKKGLVSGKGSRIQLKNAQFARDPRPLMPHWGRGQSSDSEDCPLGWCSCSTCARFSRAYLHHLFMEREPLAMQLASIHNIHMLIDEMKQAREHILDGTFAVYHAQIRAIWHT